MWARRFIDKVAQIHRPTVIGQPKVTHFDFGLASTVHSTEQQSCPELSYLLPIVTACLLLFASLILWNAWWRFLQYFGLSAHRFQIFRFQWSHSHSKLDLKSFVCIDVSLVMTTNIIRIRATIKNYDWSYVASIWIVRFLKFIESES